MLLRLVMKDGQVLGGETYLDLVRAMMSASMFSNASGVLDYIAAVQTRIEEVERITLHVGGKEIDERCESFVRGLHAAGLAELVIGAESDLDYTVKMIRLCADKLNAGDLTGTWQFLRDRLRLSDHERREIERRLGLASGKQETEA
jgi:hypothetical protein